MEYNNEIPSYYAIIPADVRYDKGLKANEKLLYGEITCLTQSTGKCFASNDYFARLYSTTPRNITRWISNLKSKGYIETELIYKENSKEVLYRFITIGLKPLDKNVSTPRQKCPYPPDKNVQDNTTSNNTIKSNIDISKTDDTVNDKESETIKVVNGKKLNKVRDHMVVIEEYETTGKFNLEEIAAKVVLEKYTEDSLKELAIEFLDYYCVNKDKLKGKVNIKARFNQFVRTDYHNLLKKKLKWVGIDFVTDDEFEEFLNEGYFKSSRCEFYQQEVLPTLDTQGRDTFNEMIIFFKNKNVHGYAGMTFKEYMTSKKRRIA